MRKKLIFLAIGSFALIMIINLFSQSFTYVGAEKCKICHKTEKQGMQHPIWEKSSHSQSVAALSSPEAAQRAQEMGVADPQTDSKCLKCHAPLYEKAPELNTEGVTCEVCHGPGSEYRKLNVMKDRDLAVKNGLILYGSLDAIKKQCLTCHENAHGKAFDFASSWEKIKHPVPKT